MKSERLTPTKDMNEVQIGPLDHKVTKIGISFFKEEEREIVDQLKRSIDLFAWTPSNIPDIDTRVMCYRLAVDPSVKPMSQRKWKVGEEKRIAIDKEVNKLASIGLIVEVKYSTCLDSFVLVKKSSNK